MSGSQVGSARRRQNALLKGGLMYAAVRTILAGCANETPFFAPVVRRRADNVFLASHANWRLFYRPYIGVCQATAAECVTDPDHIHSSRFIVEVDLRRRPV
jgi:hypothetical protein